MIRLLSLLSIILLTQYNTQGQVRKTSWSYANLIGSIDTVTREPGPISTTFFGECSGGTSSVSDDGKIKVTALSDNCSVMNGGAGIGSWSTNLIKVSGTNGETIPLNLNFSLTGKFSLSTIPGPGCYSLATVSLSSRFYTNKEDISPNFLMQHLNGILITETSRGFKSSEAKVSVEMKLSSDYYSGEKLPFRFETLQELLRKLGKTYADYGISENLSKADWNSIDVTDAVSLLKQVEDEKAGFALALTMIFSTLQEYTPYAKYLPIKLSFEPTFHYNMKRSFSLNSDNISLFSAYVSVNASTIPGCGSVANIDFSNTFKIDSITLPEGYKNDKVDLKNIKVDFGNGYELPLSYDVILANEESNMRNVQLYPNPSSKSVHLSFDAPEYIIRLEIINSLGIPVYTENIERDISSYTVENYGSLSSGTYFLNLVTHNGRIHKKMIVK